MSKYKHGDEVEAVVYVCGIRQGDRFVVIGAYETVGGDRGLVIENGGGVHHVAESHVKPVPPKPPVPGELWVNVYGGAFGEPGHQTLQDADKFKSTCRIGGKAWRYVLADNQEESK